MVQGHVWEANGAGKQMGLAHLLLLTVFPGPALAQQMPPTNTLVSDVSQGSDVSQDLP